VITWLDEDSGRSGEFPMGPMRWINGDYGNRIAVAVGKLKGEERKVKVLGVSH